MLELSTIVLVIAVLLVVIGALQPLAERLKIPATVLLAGVGVAIGTLASFLLYTPLTDRFNEVVAPIVDLPLRSSTFIYIFLPLLLFQAALTIDFVRFKQDAAPILLLAVVAVVVTTGVVGFGLSSLFGVPLVVCLLLGSVIATTDPAAVVAIFRDIGAPARLSRLVEGESLLNDAAAIALFGLLLALLLEGAPFDADEGGTRFAVSFAGGIVLGLVVGRMLIAVIPWIDNLKAAETTLTLAAPYVVFIIGDQFLHVSGVVAVVTLGLCISAWGKTAFLPENWQHVQNVWEQIAFWAGSLVFILAAILVPKLIPQMSFWDIVIILVAVISALLARAVVLFLLLPILSATGMTKPVGWEYKTAILWGGLRGAVTLALALAVVENQALAPEVKHFVAVTATGFVLFTLFVNGSTLRTVIQKLKLDRLTPRDQTLRDHILALSLAEVGDAIRTAADAYGIPEPAFRPVLDQYRSRIQEVAADSVPADDGPRNRELLVVALAALANRERELVIESYGRRATSAAVADMLLLHAERIVDATHARGRAGYVVAARKILAFRRPFRFAHFLHRTLGIDALLARKMARRFEMVQALGHILSELLRINESRIKPLFGERIAALTGRMLDVRMTAVSDDAEAIRLQYPLFAEAVAERFVWQFALQQELDRYETLRAEGLLGREVYDSLRRGVFALQHQRKARPRLDLGLKIPDMIGSLEMLDGLSPPEVKKICRLFRRRLVLPGEFIVRRGERSNRVFFISSGAVEVRFPGHASRLGRGEFFGEMALLARRRRNADIVALSFCELLVLDETRFEKFLKVHPTIKAHVEGISKARSKHLAEMLNNYTRVH